MQQSDQSITEKVLIIVTDDHRLSKWSVSDILHEMKELVIACEAEPVSHIVARIDDPHPATLIHKGKMEEIKSVCDMQDIDLVIFSCELKGVQQRNLEKELETPVIDRTQLILDIFARRAKSLEGQLQVELALLQYKLPRLTGKGQEMSRLGGGIGTLGPGETKLEIDRRRINDRITKIKRDLKNVEKSRLIKRKQRISKRVPTLAFVGYTNAGKSTLLNQLTQAGTETHDGLFTTLDSLARQYTLPNGQHVVFSDTVGFLHELPHGLVEAFHSTLEDVHEADVLLHVVDVSHPDWRKYVESVNDVLKEINALDNPTIVVLNKIDQLPEDITEDDLSKLTAQFDVAVAISAKTGEHIEELLAVIETELSERVSEIQIVLSMSRMDLVNLAHTEGEVYFENYTEKGIELHASVPSAIVHKFHQ